MIILYCFIYLICGIITSLVHERLYPKEEFKAATPGLIIGLGWPIPFICGVWMLIYAILKKVVDLIFDSIKNRINDKESLEKTKRKLINNLSLAELNKLIAESNIKGEKNE
jgi:hypothetical protein